MAKKKIDWNPRLYAVVKSAYRNKNTQKASKVLGVSSATISKRAAEIGCIRISRKPRPNYTEVELEIIEKNAHKELERINCALIQAGFESRSLEGIKKQLNKLGIDRRQARVDSGIYTQAALSLLLGVDKKTIANHVEAGRLKASIRKGITQIEYQVTAKDVRAFIKEYLPMIDIGLCDKYWLHDLLTSVIR